MPTRTCGDRIDDALLVLIPAVVIIAVLALTGTEFLLAVAHYLGVQ